ncbi:MAG: pilus assembly PilX N-terminal domain-containing protein [Candidatus Riflebacteria bacterium]|nr:pilus assembly PilX N-terminal domain-containing protein [Candidatus Riflebacteria bacterium]
MMGKKSKNNKNGSAMLMLIGIVAVLYILGVMLINYLTQERTQTTKLSENIQALYLAEAGLEKALVKVKEVFSQKLMDSEGQFDDKVLSLLDIDKAENFSMRVKITDGELVDGGTAEVLVQVGNVRSTPFKSYIDEYIDVPQSLNCYKRESRETYADKSLGGWEANLRLEATGNYRSAQRKIELMKDLKVSDLTPPAEHYTLFVTNKKDEYLREGEFRLQNWSIIRELHELVHEVATKTKESFQATMGKAGDSEFFWEPNMGSNISFEGDVRVQTLKVIRDLCMKISDIKIKDFVDFSVSKLHPYLWGKVRTNGRLHVYMPFFAADDIINYFEDNSTQSYHRPEIGYLFCSNQLHDPYLSKYTTYEGEIIKYYQKLKPYVLGITETPYPSSDPYTVTTKFDYVAKNQDVFQPMQLERIKKNAKDYCHEFHEKDLTLQGTYSTPASVWGIIFVDGNVRIGGRISGRGMIVCTGNIIITDDVKHENGETFLSLVALNGGVKLDRSLTQAKIEAAIYAKNSITGGDQIHIFGNLCVDELNRQAGEEGDLIMPKRVLIVYDSGLKSGAGNNVCFNISDMILSQRDL